MNVPVQQNPFSGEVLAKPSFPSGYTAQANTDQQRAVAEVQAAMMIARANPRDPIAAMDRILNACTRPTLAERALYSYARGGSDISGPSIRLAEAVAQQWGNIQFGVRELDQRGDMSTVQAFAWDVETNTRREVTFQVQLVRHTRKGAYRLEDPRDVYEMVANQGARRVRACILSVIPGDVIEAAVSQCEATLKAKADTSPEAMQKMLAAFAELDVTKEQIEARIQRRIEAIQPAQVVSLKKIYVSLRDNMSAVADWFDVAPAAAAGDAPAAATRTDTVKEKLKAANDGARKPAAAPAEAKPTADAAAAAAPKKDKAPAAAPSAQAEADAPKDDAAARQPDPAAPEENADSASAPDLLSDIEDQAETEGEGAAPLPQPSPANIEEARALGEKHGKEGRALRAMPAHLREPGREEEAAAYREGHASLRKS